MIAVVALNVIILVFGIRSGLEMYLANRRRKAAVLTDPANVYEFPSPSVKPVPKKPAA
jgi:predicted transporter